MTDDQGRKRKAVHQAQFTHLGSKSLDSLPVKAAIEAAYDAGFKDGVNSLKNQVKKNNRAGWA